MKLHYEIAGPEDTAVEDAPTVLLAPSLGTTAAIWDPQVPALAQRMRVVRYDHRGHGRSPAPPGPYTLAELAGDALELIDELEVERCCFCGLSLGGMVGQWLAANAPERIERLVVCASSPHMPPAEQWRERARAVREAGSTEAIADAVLARWLTPGFAEANHALVAELRAMLLATSAQGYAGCCEAMAAIDLREQLHLIRAPTLVVSGAEDPAAPPLGHGELIAQRVACARIVVLSPAAHLVSVERAAEVTALISDHLEGKEQER